MFSLKGVKEDGLRKGTSTLAEHKTAEESRKSVPWYALANNTKQYTATGTGLPVSGSDYYFWQLDLDFVDFSLFFCYDETQQPLQAPPQTSIYLTSHTPLNTFLS